MTTTYIERVAQAYAQAPICHPGDVPAWRALADETMRTAEGLHRALSVSYTPKAEPYPTAYDMLVDIARGRIVVSTANSDHPVWSLDENVAFRLVHDVVGHGTTGGGFDWAGEWRAYEKHDSIIQSPLARHALFTEAVGQVAYALTYGGFTTQKVTLLPQWMLWDCPAAYGAVAA